MQVNVLYLGVLRELAGLPSDLIEAAEGISLAEFFAILQHRYPKLAEFRQAIALAVNYEYSRGDRILHDGDEVALLPPVSGGAPEPPQSQAMQTTDHAALVRQPIDSAAVLAAIKQPDDGAIVVFDGIVRNQTRGRRTVYLEYSAYERMALQQMELLAMQARSQYGVRDVWIVHRLGRLQIGETSVYIAVASAHRAAAFDACRWVIDALKKIVPIWKKELFVDGAVWADGEPFPPDIPVAGGGASN